MGRLLIDNDLLISSLLSPYHIFGDWLKIFDGETDASPMLGLYCGNLIPPMHISSGNAIFIRFETNVVDTGLGFKMEYHATSKPNLINFELPFKASLLNDGAKWNRLPYLKIMTTFINRLL